MARCSTEVHLRLRRFRCGQEGQTRPAAKTRVVQRLRSRRYECRLGFRMRAIRVPGSSWASRAKSVGLCEVVVQDLWMVFGEGLQSVAEYCKLLMLGVGMA